MSEQNSSNVTWSELEPYAQLIRALLPRAAGISVFDPEGELRWTSEPSVAADLPRLVTPVGGGLGGTQRRTRRARAGRR